MSITEDLINRTDSIDELRSMCKILFSQLEDMRFELELARRPKHRQGGWG